MLRVRAGNSRPPVEEARGFAYQPALDGLRALAVAAVMAYHGGVAWVPGGYLGVDVFFVLSGYLITSLLMTEWSLTSRVSLRAFWTRRARRLLPALFVMIAGVAAYAWLLAEPSELGRLRGDSLATLGYVANWHYVWSGASYFERFGVASPLRHTWSLAIEEQWYLMWPLLAVLLLRAGRARVRLLGGVAIAGAVASAGLMAALFDPVGDWSRVYYGTDTRVQGLLVGAALAALLDARPRALLAASGRAVEAAGLTGAAVIAWCVLRAGDTAEWMYRGGFLLVSLASAAVIAAAVRPLRARQRPCLRAALSGRPLRSIGRVSYGLYLWHWPVDIALTSRRTGLAGAPLFASRTAVAAAAAVLSYKLVERPVRLRRLLPTRGAARAAVPLAAALSVAAVLTATAGAPQPVVAHGLVVSPAAVSTPRSSSHGRHPTADVPRSSILLAGDSSTFTLAHAFEPARWYEADWHFLAALGCGLVRGSTVSAGRSWEQPAACGRWPREWRAWSERWDVDLAVVQIGAWEVLDVAVDGRTLRVGSREHALYLASELETAIDALGARGARVVFLRVPCFGPSPDGARLGMERTDRARVDAVNAVLDSVVAANRDRVQELDPSAWMCPNGRYAEQIDGVRVRYDGVHFEGAGAAAFWSWLAPRVEELATESIPRSGRLYRRRATRAARGPS